MKRIQIVILAPTLLLVIVFLIIGSTFLGIKKGMESCGEGNRVCVYAGSGAVLVRDVEVVLGRLKIAYCEVDENFIKSGSLVDCCTVFIVPGARAFED